MTLARRANAPRANTEKYVITRGLGSPSRARPAKLGGGDAGCCGAARIDLGQRARWRGLANANAAIFFAVRKWRIAALTRGMPLRGKFWIA